MLNNVFKVFQSVILLLTNNSGGKSTKINWKNCSVRFDL